MSTLLQFMRSVRRLALTDRPESAFRDKLGTVLQSEYGYRVNTEVSCRTSQGTLRRIDLHAERLFGSVLWTLAIETKMNAGHGTHISEILDGKLRDYVEAREWFRDGERLTTPLIVLYATPISIFCHRGLYYWNGEAFRVPGSRREDLDAAAEYGALCEGEQLFRSLLWHEGSAILQGPIEDLHFKTNKWQPSGLMYHLRALPQEGAA